MNKVLEVTDKRRTMASVLIIHPKDVMSVEFLGFEQRKSVLVVDQHQPILIACFRKNGAKSLSNGVRISPRILGADFSQYVGLACFLLAGLIVLANDVAESRAQVDSDRLDPETAYAWAKLVLTNVDIEFPNKMSLVYVDASQVKRPKQNFPAFYGCFDWHSSVHGHWVLARLLRTEPDLANASRIRETLSAHLSTANLEQEAAFFARDEHKSFERMYGWAWFLRLTMELDGWDDADARRWRENLRPLERVLQERIDADGSLVKFGLGYEEPIKCLYVTPHGDSAALEQQLSNLEAKVGGKLVVSGEETNRITNRGK